MNTEFLKLRISRTTSEDQFLYAKVQFILVPTPHFRFVPSHFLCSGNGTAPDIRISLQLRISGYLPEYTKKQRDAVIETIQRLLIVCQVQN